MRAGRDVRGARAGGGMVLRRHARKDLHARSRHVGLDEVAHRAARRERGHHITAHLRGNAVGPGRFHTGVCQEREHLGGVTRRAGGRTVDVDRGQPVVVRIEVLIRGEELNRGSLEIFTAFRDRAVVVDLRCAVARDLWHVALLCRVDARIRVATMLRQSCSVADSSWPVSRAEYRRRKRHFRTLAQPSLSIRTAVTVAVASRREASPSAAKGGNGGFAFETASSPTH